MASGFVTTQPILDPRRHTKFHEVGRLSSCVFVQLRGSGVSSYSHPKLRRLSANMPASPMKQNCGRNVYPFVSICEKRPNVDKLSASITLALTRLGLKPAGGWAVLVW